MRFEALASGNCAGISLVELAVVLGITAAAGAAAIPATAAAVDAQRAAHAAAYLATRLQSIRQQAVSQNAEVALVFEQVGTRWTFRPCVDRNGNGVRRTEIQTGRDVCPDPPCDLPLVIPGVEIASDAAIPDPDGGAGSADPIRLGKSNMASFSPAGTVTSGSVFVRSARGVQFVVRLTGATGRVRVLRFDRGSRQWKSPS